MINQKLLEQIKQQIDQNIDAEKIRENLLVDNWQASDIEEAFYFFGLSPEERPTVKPEPVRTPEPEPKIEAKPKPKAKRKKEVKAKIEAKAETSPTEVPQPPTASIDQKPTTLPSAQPVSPPPVEELPATLPARNFKKILFFVISIVVVLVIGGGAFIYFYYFRSPERIAQIILNRMSSIKSLEYAGEISAEINQEMPNVFLWREDITLPPEDGSENSPPSDKESETIKTRTDFSLKFSGGADMHDSNNPKGFIASNLSFNFDSAGEEGLGLEIRNIGKVGYARITNIKLKEVPMKGALDIISSLENQWVKIDTEELKKQTEKGLKTEEEAKTQELSPEQMKKIEEVIKQSKIIKITKKFPGEKVDGVNTFHYGFTVDKTELKRVNSEIFRIIGNNSWIEVGEGAFGTETDQLLKAVGDVEGEIWIGMIDLRIHKISLIIPFKAEEEIKPYGVIKTDGKIKFALSMKNFDKPVQVEAPVSTIPLEDVMKKISEMVALPEKEIPEETTNDKIAFDMLRIRIDAENISFTEGDYDNLSCKYVSESVDIKALCDDVAENTGGIYPTIQKSTKNATKYCAFIRLPESEDGVQKYYCIDNEGGEKETVINPGISACARKSYVCPKE